MDVLNVLGHSSPDRSRSTDRTTKVRLFMSAEHVRKHVLVAGATGRFGELADVLLARGHAVRVVTRAPDSGAAARLREAGAEIAVGDFDDPDSIATAAAGVDALFATGTAHKAGLEGELRHGRNLAAAAAAAGVPHVVYCSGDGAGPGSPLPLFRVKHQVEERIRSLRVPHTILAPVYLMENLFNPWNIPALKAGVFPSPIAVGVPLQQVAIADVIALAALAIEQPERFAGQRITIVSDELTAAQGADALSRVTGRAFEADQLDASGLGPGLQALFGWLERTGHDVDISELHRRYPEVRWHTYESWLRSQRARLSTLCPQEHAVARRGWE
jgi:uncharacterized protein YbjT (DUF2867 family)